MDELSLVYLCLVLGLVLVADVALDVFIVDLLYIADLALIAFSNR